MINFFKQKFETIRYRRILKDYFEPRKDFLKESKISFIQKLKEEGIVTRKEFIRIPLYTGVLRYGLASIILILMLGGGSIIFAEKQNVNPNHPLYEFKKLGESIQMKLAAEEEKPLLHKEFAERRLEEIKQLKVQLQETQQIEIQDKETSQVSNRRQVIINNLEEDFQNEVQAILEKVETPKEPEAELQTPAEEAEIKSEKTEKSKNLCQSISEMIERHEEITPGDGEKWREFNQKCRQFFEQKNKEREENTNNNSRNNSFWRNNKDEM